MLMPIVANLSLAGKSLKILLYTLLIVKAIGEAVMICLMVTEEQGRWSLRTTDALVQSIQWFLRNLLQMHGPVVMMV